MSEEEIKVFSKRLQLAMDEKRIAALKPTYEDWVGRAIKLDKKMSPFGLGTPPAANLFSH